MTSPVSIRPLGAALLFLLLVLAVVPDAAAQVQVDLSLRRSLYLRYEPLIATVTITNRTGREIELTDSGNHKWFSFNIESVSGLPGQPTRLVPPYTADYSLNPVQLGAGQSIKRAVNITPLYPVTEFGVYRIRAVVYVGQTGQFYSSNPPLNVEITEGRTLWQQTVGVPEGMDGRSRTLTLLSHRLPDQTQIYLRIEDKETGRIYCTHQLGRTVSFSNPSVEIDAGNQIHILQNTSPKMFLYSKVGLNGEVLERKQYSSTNESRPALRRDSGGDIQIAGGTYLDPAQIAEQQAAPPPPGVSDRPVPLPKPAR